MTDLGLKTSQALDAIRELTKEQKCEIAKMMGKMIVVDEDINYNEVKEYNAFCESIGVEKNFRVDDYPEYSVCVAFIYPEELLVE